MLTVIASALGPLVVAESQIASGTYVTILYVFAAISAAFGLIAAFTPVPSAQAGVWMPGEQESNAPRPQESPA